MSKPVKTRRQYGIWSSPISPVSLSRGIGFSDLAWDASGALVWREVHADRGVLVIQPPDGQAPRNLSSDFSIRARLGYGGGDFTVTQGQVYFVEADSGRIFRQPLEAGAPRPLTPAFGVAAAPKASPDGRWLAYAHSYEGQDALAIVDVEGHFWPARLVSGRDFYMQLAWHPDSYHLAFVAWDHPNMPWDGSELFLATLDVDRQGMLPVLKDLKHIAGSPEISIFQPEFSPDGRFLAYVSDESGWWQLYLHDLEKGDHRQLTSTEAEHAEPAWVQERRTFSFSSDGHRIYFIRNQAAVHSLWQVDLDSGMESRLPLDGSYTHLEQPSSGPQGQLAVIASGGATPLRVAIIEPEGKERVVRRATAEDLPATAYIAPQPFTWAGMDGAEVYGLFYSPQSGRFESNGQPPLVISVHGGPTSQRVAAFNLQAQFFATRGYAYLDVNYRGSTGYGRAYRNMLRGNWGIYDVQDAVSGARALVEAGRAEGKRLVIMGGSAGGFTVLKALEDFPGFFKAAVCLYGISNQFTLAAETHKFEAHYSDTLLGPLPEAADVYRQRSPLFFADKIQDPIAVFHGDVDQVVPRTQSDELVSALRHRGVPHLYHVYSGEGHGFRKVETIEHFYTMVEKFLQQHVIFS